MRLREEFEQGIQEIGLSRKDALTLEVLLDIRDLLKKTANKRASKTIKRRKKADV